MHIALMCETKLVIHTEVGKLTQVLAEAELARG